MASKDVKYITNKTSPLISVSHPTRYLMDKNPPPKIDYSITNSKVFPQNNKNSVAMMNGERTYLYKGNDRYLPLVEKTRSKSLGMHTNATGVNDRFMYKKNLPRNSYYILQDIQGDVEDTTYIKPIPYTNNKLRNTYELPVNTNNLLNFPNGIVKRLNHNLTSYQQRFN